MSEETTAVPIHLAVPFEVPSETTRSTRVFNVRLESARGRKMTTKRYFVWALPVGIIMNLTAAVIAGLHSATAFMVFTLVMFGQLLVLEYGGLDR